MSVVWAVVAALAVTVILVVARQVRERLRTSLVDIRVETAPDGRSVWSQVLNREIDEADVQEAAAGWAQRTGAAPLYDWLRSRGSVDFTTTSLRLFIRSVAPAPILIRDIRAVVLRRHRPLTRTLVLSPDAGAHTATLLLYDLETDDVEAWERQQDGAIERVGDLPIFRRRHFDLAPGETEDFRVKASVSDSFVEWALHVHIEYRGRRHIVTVLDPDDRRSPFRTSGCHRSAFETAWGAGVAASPDEPLRPIDPVRGY